MRLVVLWLLLAALGAGAASLGCGRAGPPVRRQPEAQPAAATAQPAEEPDEEEQP